MIQCDNVRMVFDNITNQVCGQNHKASRMKGWDPSQNHGRESAKMDQILTHPTVINFSKLIVVCQQFNKKIIGARYYIKGFENYYGPLNRTEDSRSPRDKDGHGTHTASTAVGSRVKNAAALGGFARGTATGGAPLAHLAIYKVCWAIPNQEKAEGNTCFEEDMLAAIDDAIGDGVHVMSISIGTREPTPLKEDGIAIGAFHALKKNIVVACSAGNGGPAPSTLSNPSPWVITVGASGVDRAFFGPLVLGNGMKIEGQTVTPYKLDKDCPLVFAADAVASNVPKNVTSQCLPNSLSPRKVRGKIVLCMRGSGMRVAKGMEVKRAGGCGFILGNSQANGNDVIVDAHVLPATSVGYNDAMKILNYIRSTKNPMARIGLARTILQYRPAPVMASFTSRGPNAIHPSILKPDITAPGVNILAAWSGATAPSKLYEDKRLVKYNIISGTSMACPHVAAAAALLRAIHPEWSSAAIRSALMTTAWMKNNMDQPIADQSGNAATPFQFGSGHFRPAKAADPGLVYDASYTDYVLYLCSYGVKNVYPKFKCPAVSPSIYNFNYPSVSLPKLNGTLNITRTVTNVGASSSVYFFSARPPLGFAVKASPSVLFFSHVGQKKSFIITIKAREDSMSKDHNKGEYAFGWYTWSNGHHYVRSPMAVSLV
ncbi:subtilisin-like protease SBT5.6 [Populus alba x Populus x berolinensis]|uniref:Subtilisin-like protease SBT5.6 n=1 Tax=Populus alba x Populus x berolinensis TaxID=444605 RepID=A0AAD6M5Q3_9ROSI|nr:subtilisin-like protease SBT5.6 [Populus alba x Populus x berolinensis]